MHRAPAVSILVERSRLHLLAIVSMWLLGCFTVTAFVHIQAPLLWLSVIELAVVLGCGLVALRGWKNAPAGRLRWDGQRWYWSGFEDDVTCVLGLHIDLQNFMLVSVRAHPLSGVWLWLERRPSGEGWIALRRAIVASQGVGKTAQQANGSEEDSLKI